MTYLEWKIGKAVALVVLVFIVNFAYTLVTGRTIEEVRRERARSR